MKRLVITEAEKAQIRGQHATQVPIDLDDVVISEWLSPDEKYVIFLDELYDLENKSKLGDIWKSSDNLILFLEHSFRVSKLKREIKEHASEVFGKVLLSENKQDLSNLKPFIKQFLLSEDWFEDAWNKTKEYGGKALNYAGKFIKDTAVDTVKGVTQFGKDVTQGTIDFAKTIATGDWQKVWDLMKKGTKWMARKIRQALYTPMGILIDTILVATGYGKVGQVIVWAVVVSLDIYEFVTGDYEDKDELMIFRILFFLVDILGLVSAGAAAAAARTLLKTSGGTIKGLEMAAAKNPAFRSMLESLLKSLKKLPSKLAEFGSMMGKGQFGKLFNMAIKNVGKFINFVLEQVKSVFKSPALKPVLINAGLITGIGTGVEAFKDYRKKEDELAKKQKEEEDKAQDELAKEIIGKPTDMSSAL